MKGYEKEKFLSGLQKIIGEAYDMTRGQTTDDLEDRIYLFYLELIEYNPDITLGDFIVLDTVVRKISSLYDEAILIKVTL